MKSLNEYIIEKILINKNSKLNKIKVETLIQLKSIIWERYHNNNSFIDLTDIDISELDDLSGVFARLNKVEVIDISGWDTSNVTFMDDMFRKCAKLDVDLSNWDLTNIKDDFLKAGIVANSGITKNHYPKI